MKSKDLKQEKDYLAKENALKYPLMTASEFNARCNGFVEGFEKAREMAWEALGDTEYAVHPRIQSLLLKLGEEEVDG